jgi:hypothetical protein
MEEPSHLKKSSAVMQAAGSWVKVRLVPVAVSRKPVAGALDRRAGHGSIRRAGVCLPGMGES